MKRILAILLVCLIAASFCGCGANKGDGANEGGKKIECDFCWEEKQNVVEKEKFNGGTTNVCEDCIEDYEKQYELYKEISSINVDTRDGSISESAE